ncbi:MAG: SDR family oxidoreductase [Candidatus Binatia bacterium]|nr:SDR family oxidoreductase [Candidatus Binatia bacterium]
MQHKRTTRCRNAAWPSSRGGSSGIGKEICLHLALAGWDVAATYGGNHDGGRETAKQIEDSGVSSLVRASDVGLASALEEYFAEVRNTFGRAPELMVNNAGTQKWSPFLDLTEEDWDTVIRTNLKGTFLGTQMAARQMVDAGIGGSIVNIGSGCNKVPFPELVSYTASKGGIELLTRSSAIELGRFGIRVNCVAPGAIEIERTQVESPGYADTWSRLAPLGHVGAPRDVANLVEFLASPKADYITAQTIWVDGGAFTMPNWPYDEESAGGH